jgi:glycosyltransferase involved in cell wall biosynthesis
MRILVVAEWFLRDAVPQAAALARQGAEVSLLHVDHAREFNGSFAERDAWLAQAADAGCGFLRLPVGRKSLRSARAIAAMAARLRGRYDIAHVHDNGDAGLLLSVGRTPVVLTVHDPVPHPGHPPLLLTRRPVVAAWRRRARAIVVHGSELTGDLPAVLSGTRVRVLPLGVTPDPRPAPLPETPRVLLFGRLEPYKGLDVLVAAMRALWDEGGRAELVVAGDGPLAAEVPDDPRIVRRLGYIDEAEVLPLLRSATVVVLPYIQGSQSGVGLRAIAAGIPVVASRVGALPDLVDDPGWLVAPGDPAALAAALERALAHTEADRARIWQRARDAFSWDAVAARQLELYRELLGAGPSPAR